MPDDARRGPAETVLGTLVAAMRWTVDQASPASPASPAEDERPHVDTSFVVLGAAGVVEDRLRALAGTAGRATRAVAPIATRLVPPAVRRAMDDAVRRLDARGRATAEASATASAEVVSNVADAVIQEEMVTRTMLEVVDQLLPPILDKLTDDPTQVRALVTGQSLSMASELTQAARSKAAEGDELVDRIVNRIRHLRASRATEARADDDGAAVVPPDPLATMPPPPPPLPAGP